MTAPELQQISVDLSVNVGDEVSLYTTDGSQFLASARTNAINTARGRVYDAKLQIFLSAANNFLAERRAYVQFANAYSMWRKRSEGISVNAAGVFTVPSDSKRILEVTLSNLRGEVPSQQNIIELPANEINNSIKNPYSYNYADATHSKYVQFENTVQLYPESDYSGGNIEVDVIYLAQPIASALTSAVPDPYMWRDEILLLAEDILMGRQQNRNVK